MDMDLGWKLDLLALKQNYWCVQTILDHPHVRCGLRISVSFVHVIPILKMLYLVNEYNKKICCYWAWFFPLSVSWNNTEYTIANFLTSFNPTLCYIYKWITVLPAKSDSDFMFSLQSYQGLIIDRLLVY